MNYKKTTFWRGFTWVRFIIMSICWFIIYCTSDFLVDFFDTSSQFQFTINYLLKNCASSILMGFLFSLWFEPGIDKDFWKGKKTTLNEQ